MTNAILNRTTVRLDVKVSIEKHSPANKYFIIAISDTKPPNGIIKIPTPRSTPNKIKVCLSDSFFDTSGIIIDPKIDPIDPAIPITLSISLPSL